MVRSLGWLPLKERRKLDRLCGMHKIVNQTRGWEELSEKIQLNTRVGRGDHVKKLTINQVNTDVGKYSFLNRTVKSWNALEEEVALTKGARQFRTRAEKWLATRV